MRTGRHLIVAALLSSLAWTAQADTVVGWRTDWTGRYPDATPQKTWSNDQNVLWSCRLPATSNSTPVIVGDRIFVTAEPFSLLCVSATDGRILWRADNDSANPQAGDDAPQVADAEAKFAESRELQNRRLRLRRKIENHPDDENAKREFAELDARVKALEVELAPLRKPQQPQTHDTNGYSSPTPVSDGKRVFAHYGNGVTAAFDLDGKRLWTVELENTGHGWGHSSSPAYAPDSNTLIVLVRDLHGLDADTGKVKWTAKSRHRWGSPVVTRVSDTSIVLTPNGEIVRAGDGRVLATGVAGLEYATPVLDDGIAYYIENNSRAVKLPGSAEEPFEIQTVWTARVQGDRHYASPVIHDGLIYTISRNETMTVLDAPTGQIVYERRMQLGGSTNSAYPSVTLAGAGGHELIYVSSETGTTVVMKPGREYDEVARNKVTGFRGSPVFVGGRLYLRCFDALRCIGDSRAVLASP